MTLIPEISIETFAIDLLKQYTFAKMLAERINISYQKSGQARGDLVWLIYFTKPGGFIAARNSLNNKSIDILRIRNINK